VQRSSVAVCDAGAWERAEQVKVSMAGGSL
jgi:hypothetical protein